MASEVIFRVGKGIDLRTMLRPSLQQHADRAAYFLDMVRRKTRVNWSDVRLNSKHLAKIMGRAVYAKIIDDLAASGLVTKSRSYRVGMRSKGYAMTPSYAGLEKVEYRPSNVYLIDNLRRFWRDRKEREQSAPADPLLESLRSQLTRIGFDEVALSRTLGAIADREKRLRADLIVESIRGRRVVIKCDNDGRVHHSVARCPKVIRKTMTVDDEPTCEIDVVNCQPYFMAMVYAEWIKSDRRFSRFPLSSFTPCPIFLSEEEERESHPLWCHPDGLSEFIGWCERGEVYERLAELAGWSVDDSDVRESVKTRVYRDLLYADAAGLRRPDNTLAVACRAQFPDLFAMLWDAQQRTMVDSVTRKRVRSTRHAPSGKTTIIRKSILPFYMQRIESQVVVRTVARRWLEASPGRFIATIHDAIMVRASDADDGLAAMREAFAEFGLHPQFKVSR